MIEKLVFALFVTTRTLKHYLQFFPIVMLIEYLLRTIMENPETNGRSVKRVMEIRPLIVTFESRTTIKGQILGNFITKFIPGSPP